MKDSIGTETDPAAREWAITDQVIQLRMLGTSVVYQLPTSPSAEPTLGSAATCWLRLNDPQISRQHAALVRKKTGWVVRDLGSKNGLQIDGAYCAEGALGPGTELTLGGVILVAESEQLIALREFLARLLGWHDARGPDVDRALRSVRMAATHHVPLVLSGKGELALVARALHTRVRGRDKPFILCDPRRRTSDGGVRSVANYDEPGVALRAAFGGSLCFIRRRLPAGAAEVFSEARDPKARVHLIVCEDGEEHIGLESMLTAAPIAMPPLAERADDVDRIISEYANEVTVELRERGVVRAGFTDEDRAWVRKFSAASLPDIEKGTRRLVAVRASRSVSIAAQRLGMAAVSLSRWIERRGVLERDPLVATDTDTASRRDRRLQRRRLGSAQA